MEYLTIATTGSNATFGSLALPRQRACGGADETRFIVITGVTAPPGSATRSNSEYVQIATTGNATQYGSMTVQSSPGGNTQALSSYGGGVQ
jgi:hypothetical protein